MDYSKTDKNHKEEEVMMRYFTPQNLLIAGLAYWFLFRRERHGGGFFGNDKPFGTTPSQVNGEGYP